MLKPIRVCLSVMTIFMIASFMAILPAKCSFAEEDTWAIYWYICGSDLETDDGSATADIREMLEVSLPENVTVVLETGGAKEWQNDIIDANYLERYVYNSEGFDCVYQKPSASMGDPETLRDFLEFCTTKYPAEHTGIVFWNHGSGSVYGAEFDELYDKDSLTLNEFYQAFGDVYTLSYEQPPVDFIGFDCCLMASIDTAATFCDIAHYLVASEETIPGYGWDYTKWIGALAQNPAMDAKEVGIAICDSYMETNEELDIASVTTLSVIDLTAVPALLDEYEKVGAEALDHLLSDSSFLAQFTKAANSAENYGGNTPSSGYANQVDLKDLVVKSMELMPETSEDLLQALDRCVVYKVNGEYRQESSGLSCYFSLNKDEKEVKTYCDMCVSDSVAQFYENCIDREMQDFFTPFDIESDELAEFSSQPEEFDMEDIPVTIDDNGIAFINVEEELLNTLVSVYCEMGFYDSEEDSYTWFGIDNDLQMDWDNGIFGDNFHDAWGSIDDHLCYMELSYQGAEYNLYLVPILLNGEECQLNVVYDYNDLSYQILGAQKGIDESGAADRNLIQLKPGDKITTLLYVGFGDIDAEDDLYPAEEFEVTEDTEFYDVIMGDGEFVMSFLLTDYHGNQIWSEPVLFTVEDDQITTSYF